MTEWIETTFRIPYWIDLFRTFPPALCFLLVGVGLLLLLYGRVIFLLVVILNAAAIGAYAGWQIGLMFDRPHLGMAVVAVFLAAVAWPMLKVAASFLTGVVGAVLLVYLWPLIWNRPEYLPVAAVVGFVALAIAGWYLFKPAVIAFTALQGSLMIVLAGLALLDQWRIREWDADWWAGQNPLAVAAVVLGLTFVGVLYQGQLTEEEKKLEDRKVVGRE